MIAWDDIRYFLAVARGGSVRAAAEKLGVNHSTILRHLSHLEAGLGARLFDKLPSGYRITSEGAEILGAAERMEASSDQLQTRIFGRDQSVRGLLRVTSAASVATHLVIPELAPFAKRHPEVELELLSVDEVVNLTNREADVAIRIVYDRDKLPHNAHGLTGPEVYGAVYIARHLLTQYQSGATRDIRWIIRPKIGVAEWAHETGVSVASVPFRTSSAEAQLAAVREGIGMASLPCFIGDADPELERVPGSPRHLHGTLWLLTQGDNRKTRRVKLFTEHLAGSLFKRTGLLAGLG